MTLCALAILALAQTPYAPPVYFGVVYDLVDGSADGIPGWYQGGAFRDANTAEPFALHKRFHATSSDGRSVSIVIDSTHPDREFAQGEYTVHVLPAMAHTRDVSILFWDGTVSTHILRSDHPPLDTATAAVLFPQAHRLVRLALTEADSDVVASHDTVQFEHPYLTRLAQAPGLEVIEFRAVFKRGRRVADDRASVFFLYSRSAHRIIFSNFGHPEWSPTSEHVFALSPRFFFSIDRDPHVYLLCVYYRAWESKGEWVVFDAQSGRPLTQALIPLGGWP